MDIGKLTIDPLAVMALAGFGPLVLIIIGILVSKLTRHPQSRP